MKTMSKSIIKINATSITNPEYGFPHEEMRVPLTESEIKKTLELFGTPEEPKMLTPQEFLDNHIYWWNKIMDECFGDYESIEGILHQNVNEFKTITIDQAVEVAKLYWDDPEREEEGWYEEVFIPTMQQENYYDY